MTAGIKLQEWLTETCAGYRFTVLGAFDASGAGELPVTVRNDEELADLVRRRGQLLPLPKEPAALANILEVSIVDYLIGQLTLLDGSASIRGTERGYPDLEVSGEVFGGGYHAVDIKVAKRKKLKSGRTNGQTQSRITLYTGNTYFRYPTLHWPGTPRPFQDYATHLDVLGIYTLDESDAARVTDLELIVQQPWAIASHQRSSTTREYLGAVINIDDLRAGRGEFDSPEEFYKYWRRFPFKIGKVVQQQLDRALRDAGRQEPRAVARMSD